LLLAILDVRSNDNGKWDLYRDGEMANTRNSMMHEQEKESTIEKDLSLLLYSSING
jgi:hypothetical protein